MRTNTIVLAAAALTTTATAAPAQQPCPGGGYIVAAASADSLVALPQAFLDALARAAAYRWRVPSRARNDFTNWERVSRRTLPPEPRWADDWQPEARHRAVMVLTLYRDGRARAADPAPGSGDRVFDRSLRSIAAEPMPAAPPLPPWPDGVAGDSLRVALYFGHDSVPAPHGAIRFAAMQTPVRLSEASRVPFSVPRGPGTPPPAVRRAVVKYDVSELGQVVPRSIQFLEVSDREFERAIEDNLRNRRFEPATQNCRPIPMTVVQRYGF